MNKHICDVLDFYTNKKHYQYRQDLKLDIADEFKKNGLSPVKRISLRLVKVLEAERPVIFNREKIAFLRTIKELPDIFTVDEWKEIKRKHFIHEKGYVCNINPDYASTIAVGLMERRNQAEKRLKECREVKYAEGIEFLESLLTVIDAVMNLADRYRAEAERLGNMEVSNILRRVPGYGARTFHEALQFFRILHFTLWVEGEYHNTIGRFDQYMYPYLKADLESGRLDYDSAFSLLEEFFISFNKDSDLFPGVQKGDNGQSLVLGGIDEKGNDAFNVLSEMCLKASKELKLIDPKINLRVHKNTNIQVYELATELTKEGLGFPQYSNDDIVIPSLVDKGYELKDARNYVVAACWEFIIPKYGMDIPNIGALSFPKVIDKCRHEYLDRCKSFSEFLDYVKLEVKREFDKITDGIKDLWILPGVFISILMDECINKARDISKGGKYNNYGIHGVGLSTAADSLAVIKKYIFDEKAVKVDELIRAVDLNFAGYEELMYTLRYEAPKMGNDDDCVDSIACELLDCFADASEGKVNERGGCYRVGTGSAMYYLWHAKEIGASPDGRKKGEGFGANYSPSLFARIKGPVSVMKSFTKPNLGRIINGGPLTLEFSDNVFNSTEGIKKMAMMVNTFFKIGGLQLQLNSVSREKMLDAQKNPEKYKNLIVRIWGWSAYFNELDKEYQEHIIKRQEYS